MSHLRTLRDRLSELGRTRAASGRVARRSAVWRSQIAPVVRETEDAGSPRPPRRQLPCARAGRHGDGPGMSAPARAARARAGRRARRPRRQRQATVPPARRQPTERSRSPGGSPPSTCPLTRMQSPRSSLCELSPATSWSSPASTPSRPTPQCGKGPVSSASPPRRLRRERRLDCAGRLADRSAARPNAARPRLAASPSRTLAGASRTDGRTLRPPSGVRRSQPAKASMVAITMACTPVSSVGWMTGAKLGLWLVGTSCATRPARAAVW